MEKDFCSYHYKSPATFECKACKKFYGDCCIRQQLNKHTCPLCHRQLTFLGAANTAPPFWEQMSSFFRYPIQKAPLGLLGISAAMFSLVEPNVLGLVIVVVFACVLTKYAYSIIQASKEGQTTAPSLRSAFSSENLDVFFKQLAVLVLASVAMIPIALTDSAILMFLASTIINMLIPASVIVLALTNEVLAAMNPAMLFSIVKAVGWRYILLCLFLFFLSQGPGIMVGMLMGSSLSIPMLVLIFGYFSLVMCRLLGYTVYQSQAELGFVSDENEIDCNLSEDELVNMKASQRISTVEIYIKEGRYEDARKALSEHLNDKPTNLLMEEYYHRLLMATADHEEVIQNAALAIPRFQSSSRDDLSLAVYQDCLKIEKDFRPEKLATAVKLAKVLYSKLNTDDAIKLLLRAHRKYPDDPQIPEAYLLAAEIFIQSRNDKSKAGQLLAYVKKFFPDCPQEEKIHLLENLISQPD